MMDLLLIFFAALGVVLFFWCLLGILVTPVFGPDMVTLCFAEGKGRFLEHRVRSYGWLREGELTGGRLVIVDRGLSEEGLKIAACLCEKYEWVSYYQGELSAVVSEGKQPQNENWI